MLQIKEIINSIFNSKTYILYKYGEDTAWLVDIGDITPVITFLHKMNLSVAGLFITHAHFDHIYGILDLLEHYPDCKVYVTEYAKEGLASEKLNMSKYYEELDLIIYNGDNIVVVHDGDKVMLYEGEPYMHLYETPGHNPGCLTMVQENIIFTGDSYIPGIGVTTNIRYADKEQAQASLFKIMKLAEGKVIFSGHQI